MTKEFPIKSPRKLIEVALPLDAINDASAKEKGNPFLKGHPRNLHQWWARRPQATARAVIFAQMVNDPGFQQGNGFKYGMNKKDAAKERKRLFDILQDLVRWENSNNRDVIARARAEIVRSWREVCELNRDHPQAIELFNASSLPAVCDAFAGGGAIPVESLRLGMPGIASDINPIAVLINKSLIEFLPRFAGRCPIGPSKGKKQQLGIESDWPGLSGFAEDLRRFSEQINKKAKEQIGKNYPDVEVTPEVAQGRDDLEPLVGKKLRPIAWIWARTVRSPNPAFSDVYVPLISTFVLSRKAGQKVYVEPVVNGSEYSFTIKTGEPTEDAKKGTVSRSGAKCLVSGSAMSFKYLREQAKEGKFGCRLMAIVATTGKGRLYVEPLDSHQQIAIHTPPKNIAETEISHWPGRTNVVEYGMTRFRDLFTKRQLCLLSTISDLIREIHSVERENVPSDNTGSTEHLSLEDGGAGSLAYHEAIAIFLALGLDKVADYNNSICMWNPVNQNIGHLFTKQAIPMSWDFVEAEPFSGGLAFPKVMDGLARVVESLPFDVQGTAFQHDCANEFPMETKCVISTDPPYYDNISYADLSDFFYIWLRRSLRETCPSLFSTIATPKAQELVASPYRHGGKSDAETFFMLGMTHAMSQLRRISHEAFPVAIYYAFKQSETKEAGTSSSGWESFLEAVLRAGFSLSGTWPMRTERATRSIGQGANALASSIVLVCRSRAASAISVSRREFIRELNEVLPEALDEMTRGIEGEQSPVAPVDLSQAIIGPGMAVFSKYAAVLEADGTPMTVQTALQLINRFLAEDDFDADTQFCLHWFDQHAWAQDAFGEADVLARAKSTSVNGLTEAGVIRSGAGRVQLLKWNDYPDDWNPETDTRIPVWEVLHQLIRTLKQGGESSAGKLLGKVNVASRAEAARQLAYRLYTLCERKGWAEDARAYNELITSWPAIVSATPQTVQAELF